MLWSILYPLRSRVTMVFFMCSMFHVNRSVNIFLRNIHFFYVTKHVNRSVNMEQMKNANVNIPVETTEKSNSTYPNLINSLVLSSLKLQLSNISGQCVRTVCHMSSFCFVFSKLNLHPRRYIKMNSSSEIKYS